MKNCMNRIVEFRPVEIMCAYTWLLVGFCHKLIDLAIQELTFEQLHHIKGPMDSKFLEIMDLDS